MTTDKKTTAAALEQRAHDLEAHAYQLEQRVLDGDDQITHEQITEARSRCDFLRLQAEGKRRREAREAREARSLAAQALHQDVAAVAPTDPLREGSTAAKAAAKTIAGAFTKYLTAVRAYDEQATALARRANDLQVPPWGEDLEGLSFFGRSGSTLVARVDDATVWHLERSTSATLEASLRKVLQDAMKTLPADDRVRL
ncbi:hypothetical protein [Nocardioides humi]|uniref:ATPase n=1 Tax=Nocardioides humi TaxID=449461 RepID=A0ABN2BPZ8_9ACTN|nr:hypothetical protein [Nocardioides humi]